MAVCHLPNAARRRAHSLSVISCRFQVVWPWFSSKAVCKHTSRITAPDSDLTAFPAGSMAGARSAHVVHHSSMMSSSRAWSLCTHASVDQGHYNTAPNVSRTFVT